MMLIKGILQPCQYLPARNDFATYSQLMIVLPIVNYFSEQYQLLFQKRNSGNKLAKKNGAGKSIYLLSYLVRPMASSGAQKSACEPGVPSGQRLTPVSVA